MYQYYKANRTTVLKCMSFGECTTLLIAQWR